MPSPEMNTPTHMIVKNKVANFAEWEAGFLAHSPERQAAGLKEMSIYQYAESETDFFVLFEVQNPHAAQEFIHSRSLQNFKQSIGIISPPEYFFLKESPFTSPTTAPLHRPFILRALKAVDEMNSAAFAENFSVRGSFQFSNQPPVTGPLAIQEAVQWFFTSIQSLEHRIDQFFEHGSDVSLTGTVRYVTRNSKEIIIPFSNHFKVSLGKFDHWQIFMDLAPLYL